MTSGKEKATEAILDSIADGVFTVDRAWRISSFNRAAELITGIPREDAIGQRCCEVFRASICEESCALRQTMESDRPVINKTVYIINANGERVPISISTAILKNGKGRVIGGVETFRDLSLVEELRRELEKRYTYSDIISKNNRMQRIMDILPEIAESDSTVLIDGESGTGKELMARAIHNLSPRREKPMVTVNCGALPDNLLESELFGYKAGAFTDARMDKPGRFSLADGGTIFLDEIGDITPALQVRLLRFLQEKTFEPLGSNKPVKVDVRIVAATNRNLKRLVDKKQFRQDLYFRINVISVTLPPLRERKEDIPILVDHFINHFNKLRSKEISGVTHDVLQILMQHEYPGNIRELENIIEHAFVLCRKGLIMPAHLPEYLRPQPEPYSPTAAGTLEELEAHFILEVLRKNDYSREATAGELGIHKTTLWRKMKKLGISIPARGNRNT